MGCCQSRKSKSSIAPEVECTNNPMGDKSTILRRPSFIRGSMTSMISAVTVNFTPTSALDLTDRQKTILQEHWKKTLLIQRPDYFHKVMLTSIQQSPKMNEVIACQMYCVRDLSKWPKLDRMSRGVRDFIDRQIIDNNLDPALLSQQARELGAIHSKYAQFGFKPAFLDIWQNSALTLLEKLKFDDETEKELFIDAWRIMIRFIAELMIIGYDASMQLVRSEKKKKESSLEKTSVTNVQDDINGHREDISTYSDEHEGES